MTEVLDNESVRLRVSKLHCFHISSTLELDMYGRSRRQILRSKTSQTLGPYIDGWNCSHSFQAHSSLTCGSLHVTHLNGVEFKLKVNCAEYLKIQKPEGVNYKSRWRTQCNTTMQSDTWWGHELSSSLYNTARQVLWWKRTSWYSNALGSCSCYPMQTRTRMISHSPEAIRYIPTRRRSTDHLWHDKVLGTTWVHNMSWFCWQTKFADIDMFKSQSRQVAIGMSDYPQSGMQWSVSLLQYLHCI
jgi:hypothetical protein